MPLPKESFNYLNLALKKIRKKGFIHLYTFAEEGKEKEIKEKMKKYIKKFKIQKIVKAGVYGPKIFRVCVDLKIL